MAHLQKLVRRSLPLAVRAVSTTAARPSDISVSQQQKYYPKVGDRDIVGYGFNGLPSYADLIDYPAPAVRFMENSPEVMALREKEKGDWKSLTLDEKKALYRASFCQTYSEMNAPTGEWKRIVAGILTGFGLTCWVMIYLKMFVYPEMPSTITEEWKDATVEYALRQGQQPITGLASQWDYEKNEWK